MRHGLLITLALFLLLVFMLGMAFIHWEAGRELRKVAREETRQSQMSDQK